MLAAVFGQVGVDPLGHPQEGEFTQRGEVAGTEVVGQGRVDLARRVDVAVRHAAAQRLWRHVDQLYLVGAPDYLVGNGLALPHPGDRLDHVAQRLEVLDVDGRDHVDAGGEQFLDVLPALGVAGARHVGVGQLVDQGHPRGAAQDGVHVHLGERGAPVPELPAGHLFEAVEHHLGARPMVVLHESDHAVGTAFDAAVRLRQHRVGLADAGCRAEVDPELAACHVVPRSCLEAAAHAGLGDQLAGMGRVLLQFATQLGHVDTQVVGPVVP